MKPDLSNEYFTKVIPSLDTIEIDSRYVDAKTVECERLNINGKKLEAIINEEKLQPSDLVGREIIGEDDYYVLWDDNGQPIDVKLPEGYCPSFANCKGLKEWKWDLNSLEDGTSIFSNCSNLVTVSSEFKGLKNGKNMFQSCVKLTSITQDFPNLIYGSWMFYGCSTLKKFEGTLESLETGTSMFTWCTSLREFVSDLSMLKDGDSMFAYCRLNTPSVKNIINCLRTTNVLTTTATLDLGIDKTLATDSELLEFLQISEGVAQSITIVPPVRTLEDGTVVGGGTWTVNLIWY